MDSPRTHNSPALPAQSHSSPAKEEVPSQAHWLAWWSAFRAVLPIYIATHLAFLLISCLAVLFLSRDFAGPTFPLSTIWQSWYRWDADIFFKIAEHGYSSKEFTAFFPLYPFLERGALFLGFKQFSAGLLISNLADLALLVVLYRLVLEDFDKERASRAVLFLSLFPSAFFLAAGYNESLLICLAVLSLYHIRRGQWWLAGLFGCCASLTRSVGILLALPFCYEYLRQHDFQWRKLRLNILGGLLILAGLGLYCLYCYLIFHDSLAFSHAQATWNRTLQAPWTGWLGSFQAMRSSRSLLSFRVLRNLTDLLPDLFMLVLVVLAWVGPWRFPATLRVYAIYAVAFYLFPHFFPNGGTGLFPLESMARFMLEVVPAFIVLATIAKRFPALALNYLLLAGALLFFLLVQFLTNHWVL